MSSIKSATLTFLLIAITPPLVLAAPPQAARSVHLFYQAPEAVVFYNELTVEQSQTNSYFMACGFRHGYFGIQQLRTNRIVLFSVWDPGKQDDPKSVPEDQRVKVLFQAPDVEVHRFGNEGTGNQCKFPYAWRTGETYRFMVKATVQSNQTAYASWFFVNETKQWKHLATFATQTDGKAISGFYSFVEDFRRDGVSATEPRRARLGNGWIKTAAGGWLPLTNATFTADSTPLDNIAAGIERNEFYLATGGDTTNSIKLRSMIRRPAPAIAPQPPQLPEE